MRKTILAAAGFAVAAAIIPMSGASAQYRG
jgi:hypothetical protein